LPSRLYIDRIFTLKGKGTIVTGTLLEGTIKLNEQLYIYPLGESVRVKGIQIHGKTVSMASYGHRVALNVTMDTLMLQVGDLITSEDMLTGKYIVDVSLRADTQIKHWERIRFFVGTREVYGRIATPQQSVIALGDRVQVQLRLESPIFANVGDRYILRRFSPVEIMGGGVILNLNAQKRDFGELRLHHTMTSVNDQALITAISQLSLPFTSEHQAFKTLSYSRQERLGKLETLVAEGVLVVLSDNLFLSYSCFEKEKAILYDEINHYHIAHPYQIGINRATLKSKKFKTWSKPAFDAFLNKLETKQYIRISGVFIATGDFEIIEDAFFHRVSSEIMTCMSENAFTLTRFGELKKIVEKSQNHYDIFTYLNYLNIIVKIGEDNFITKDVYQLARNQLLQWFKNNDTLSVAAFRDFLGTSRKISVTLLEHFDAIALTKRIDNNRELIKKGVE